jgi:hypothetical protein
MAERLNLDDDGYEVMHFPAPKSLAETLEETMRSVQAPGGLAKSTGMTPLQIAGQAIHELVGDQSWHQLQPQLEGFMQMREGKILLMSPSAIVVK